LMLEMLGRALSAEARPYSFLSSVRARWGIERRTYLLVLTHAEICWPIRCFCLLLAGHFDIFIRCHAIQYPENSFFFLLPYVSPHAPASSATFSTQIGWPREGYQTEHHC